MAHAAGALDNRALEARNIQQRIAERKANRGARSPGPGRGAAQLADGSVAASIDGMMQKSASLPQLAPSSPSGQPSSPGSAQGSRGSPSKTTAALKLSSTMQRAAQAGLSQVQIANAEKALQQSREAEALTVAVLRGNPAELRTALSRAQKAGVSKALISSAKGQVQQLDSYELMEKAMRAEDASALKSAISLARKSDMGKADIEAAELMLSRIEARGRLRAAMDLKQAKSLKWAIDEAEILGLQCVDDSVLKQARSCLKQMQAGG